MKRSRSRPAARACIAATLAAAATAAYLPVGAASAQVAPAHERPAVVRACSVAVPGYASCFAQVLAPSAPQPAGRAPEVGGAAAVSPPTAGYGPADIKSMYGVDTSRGSGQTIAVVDAYDQPKAEADLAAYRKAWQLPACTTANGCFRKVNQRGKAAPPVGDPGWGMEISLDLDAVSSACPRCKILLVEADSASFDDLGLAVNRAVKMGAKVVSNSYGGPEVAGILDLGATYYDHPGVAMVVASGDAGFGPANFPASWTRSIAVGGTNVTRTASGWRHTAWNGASSGCSAWIAKPAWQKDANCLMRTVADVSALADPATGLAVYDTYGLPGYFGVPNGWVVVGGTSLAAPLVAGMIGLAGNAAQLATAQRVYAHPGGLRDVTAGSNGFCGDGYLCTATKGYDGPTGRGTPRGLGAL